jgi:hypothetical protein
MNHLHWPIITHGKSNHRIKHDNEKETSSKASSQELHDDILALNIILDPPPLWKRIYSSCSAVIYLENQLYIINNFSVLFPRILAKPRTFLRNRKVDKFGSQKLELSTSF